MLPRCSVFVALITLVVVLWIFALPTVASPVTALRAKQIIDALFVFIAMLAALVCAYVRWFASPLQKGATECVYACLPLLQLSVALRC